MTAISVPPGLQSLVQRLDAAVVVRDDAGRCRAVKQALVAAVTGGEIALDPRFALPASDRYARRLLYRDPELRYTVLAMVWDRGQGTALHDHAGTWCVECVYRGRIRVTSYSVRGGEPERDLVRFEPETVVMAGVGEAGALIPPFEYHRLENPDETPALTIHVYGGEMTYCHVYEPTSEGGYRRRYRELSYTD
ncbi:MAG TPA: cysteine dioxygenase family protein [Gemmatimonadales bacterium]|jgi:predicted metal-dependent enzyme (double-stranded beta helix superfamily)|nr:cysteine dioxygenase family protein [Gemmatimonadales bacterium]